MEGIFANSEHMVNRATQNATKHSKVSKRDLELVANVDGSPMRQERA